MAKMRCRCGAVLRDDDPANSFLLFRDADYDVDLDSVELVGRGRPVSLCPTCGRLWVFWNDFEAEEYEHVSRVED
jgi:hypothetical protein